MLTLIVVTTTLALVAQDVTSAVENDTPASSVLAETHRWVLANYPSLTASRLAFKFYGGGQDVRVEVREVLEEPSATTAGHEVVRLVVEVHRTREGAVERLVASGDAVSTVKLKALKEQVIGHPSWSTLQINDAVRGLGGRFGPLEGAPPRASAEHLGHLAGEPVTIVSASFDTAEKVGPVWIVEAIGTHRTYYAAFEPITGHVIAVTSK